jgi:outer membrane protein, heavy metal efflux system
MRGTKTITALLLLMSGCATLDTTKSFEDVQALTGRKVNSKLIWNHDESTAKEIDSTINKLLSETLDVDDAVQIALLSSPSVQATYEEVGVAQADLVQAGLLQNPTFLIERRFKGKALEMDIAQNFIDLFFIPLRTKVAENTLEAAKLKVAGAVIEHSAKTKEAFFELQASMQMLEMRQAISRASDASALAATKLFKAGNIMELEMQDEQNLANEARLQLATAENEVIEKREHLNVLMGLWNKRINWKVNNRLQNIPANNPDGTGLERLAVMERYDLQSERRNLDALGSTINLSGYTSMLSDAVLSAHSEREPEGSRSTGPSLEIPIPLFNLGGAQRARAYAEFKQAASQFVQHAVEVRSDVRSSFTKMRTARQKATYFQQEVLPLQARMLDQMQLQYNGMFKSVFDLLEAKRKQIEAGEQFIEALKDYWLSRTELEMAVGGRIENVPTMPEPEVSSDHSILPKKDATNTAQHHHGA